MGGGTFCTLKVVRRIEAMVEVTNEVHTEKEKWPTSINNSNCPCVVRNSCRSGTGLPATPIRDNFSCYQSVNEAAIFKNGTVN
jgi:hypothetical protein